MLIVLSVIHLLICLAIIIAMYFHRGNDSLFGGNGVAGMTGTAMPKAIMTPLDKLVAVFVGLFFISTLLINYLAHEEGKIDLSKSLNLPSATESKAVPDSEEKPSENKDTPPLDIAR